MLLLTVKDRFWPERAEVVEMTGDVNVAVSEFGSLGSDGRVTVTDESSALASSVFEVLDRELLTLEGCTNLMGTRSISRSDLPRTPVPSMETRTISGPHRRHASQNEIDADVIVYAVLDESDGTTSTTA